MKSLFKKSLAVILTLIMVSSCFVCLAAVDTEATKAHYGQFKNYLLLGNVINLRNPPKTCTKKDAKYSIKCELTIRKRLQN